MKAGSGRDYSKARGRHSERRRLAPKLHIIETPGTIPGLVCLTDACLYPPRKRGQKLVIKTSGQVLRGIVATSVHGHISLSASAYSKVIAGSEWLSIRCAALMPPRW
jgi:hypothetical protein